MMMQYLENSTFLDETFAGLIEAIPDAILIKDCKGRYWVANNYAKTLYNWQDIDWQGKTDKQLGLARPHLQAMHEKCLESDKTVWNADKLVAFDERIVDVAGNVREYVVRKSPIFTKSGKRKGIIVIRREITDIKLAERNLLIADAVIESQEAIVISDSSNSIIRINNSYTRLTGYSSDEVIGKSSNILKSGLHDQAFYQNMWIALAENKFWQGEIWDRRKNGEIYPKWLTIKAVTDPDGEILNYIGAFTDLSKHKGAEEEIYRLAFYDPLTNLPNRRLFRERLDLALSNCAHNFYHGAVLMIDLDNFKLINDTKGHTVGDLLLVALAQRLKCCVSEVDFVARLGGDEFVIIMEILGKDTNEAITQAEVLSKNILKASSQPFLIAGEELHCSLSIGICMISMHTTVGSEVLKRADVAMYQAKSAGRNTLRFFDEDLHKSLEKRLSLVSELRQALPNNELRLYCQAQVNRGHKIIGAELLLRWEHPRRGLVAPDEFIMLAEESGLIIPIGLWVIFTACTQLKMWEENPLTNKLTLAVNVSARQFSQSDFVEQVCVLLQKTGANGTLLKIELTESLVIQDIDDAIEKMDALKLLGISFSLDDFGTGYSSLSYLKRLPISQLKIDRSFVREIHTNQGDAIIAQSIIGMANNFRFNVIAEGVENEAQRTCLEQMGCFNFQGYLFSKPVPLEEFEKLINNQ